MSDDTRISPAAAPIRYGEFVTLVACLMALNALAIDVMLPALQQIGEALGVADANARQLTITAYIIGFGIAQVAYGSISDRFGRKPVLLFGLVIYVIAGFLAASAWSFPALLAFRALQGLGAAATRVIAISLVRDCYSGRQMASVMSLVMMVFMAVPILAPGIGELIMLASGWRSIFALVAFLGMAVTLWSLFRLPETLAVENRRPLTVAKVGEAFRIVLTNRVSLGYTFGTALIMGCLFAFINSAQQIYVGIYDLGSLFPLAFSGSAILIGAAAFANSRLVQGLGMRRLSHGALIGFAALSAALAILSHFSDGPLPFPLFFVLISLIFCCFGFIGTNFNALAMEPLGQVAGTASSVLGSMQTVGGGMAGAFVGAAYDGTATPLGLGFMVLSLAALVVVAAGEGWKLFGTSVPSH
jgi:DHA1 family bicyclomycin/chloramphenicol resistance-like MFS transporter